MCIYIFRPLPLELTAADEIVVLENMEVFKKNGFTIISKEEDSVGGEGRRPRLYLTTVPSSKNHVLGVNEVHELIFLLNQTTAPTSSSSSSGTKMRTTTTTTMRPSRVTALFASRACRMSVMIGDALSAREMGRVVRNLATLEHPWACPHGRPTMRHLISLLASERASRGNTK